MSEALAPTLVEDESRQVIIDLSGGASNEALLEIARHAEQIAVSSGKGAKLIERGKQVVLSNEFVVGIESGTILAFRIIRIAAAQIPRGATEVPEVYFSADDMEQLGLTRQRLTSHMADIVKEIMDYRIKIATYDKDTNECTQLSAVNVFSKCSAHAKQGAMTVKLNPDIAGYFLNQRRDYTKYSLMAVAGMSSYPAAKLHEVLICKSHQYGTNLLRFSIDELRTLLTPMAKQDRKQTKARNLSAEEVEKRKHRESAGVFLSNVIKLAVDNINRTTESDVHYRAIKDGRNTIGVRFYIDDYGTLEDKQHALELSEKLHRKDEAFARIEELLLTGEGEVCPEELRLKVRRENVQEGVVAS